MEVGDEAAGSQELTAVLDTEEAGGIAIRGGALRLVGYGVSVLLSVAGVAAMTRHLGSADYELLVTRLLEVRLPGEPDCVVRR